LHTAAKIMFDPHVYIGVVHEEQQSEIIMFQWLQ